MDKLIPDEIGAAEKRAAAERIIARYPSLTEQELQAVLRYLRKQASAMDCALIASNEAVLAQYRSLCRDHHLNRLNPLEMALLVLALTALALLVIFMHLLAESM